MKRFACGDVVPGCTLAFEASEEEDLLQLVATHARVDHGIEPVSDELVAEVRQHIETV